MTAQPVVEARALSRRFGEGAAAVEAVRGVDLQVSRGEIVLIMGPSGSGKTTLLTMLGALLRPSEGSIQLLGTEVSSLPERDLPRLRARHIGFIFQDFNLMPSLDARENVELVLNLVGIGGREARRRAEERLEQLGLDQRLTFLPEQLSGGEKQRVAIARALANDPELLLADEPTANLDSGNGREVMRELRRLAIEQRRSAIIVSHDERLREIADRVLWLEDGAFASQEAMARDPVCGMVVEREGARHTTSRDGEAFYFCSRGCLLEFEGKLPAPSDDAASARG